MPSFAEVLAADRRLVILRILVEEAPGYTANVSILHGAMGTVGHRCTRDQVEGDAAWLAEAGLVTLEHLAIGVTTVTASQRGVDVATGRTVHPGVKRPAPGP
jgi:hypothetical protein